MVRGLKTARRRLGEKWRTPPFVPGRACGSVISVPSERNTRRGTCLNLFDRDDGSGEMRQRRIAAVQNSSHQLRRLSPDPRIKVHGNARDASGEGAPPIRQLSDFDLGRSRERSASQNAYSAPFVKSNDGQRRNVSSIASFPRKDGRRYPQTDRNVALRESSCVPCDSQHNGGWKRRTGMTPGEKETFRQFFRGRICDCSQLQIDNP